MLSFGKPVPHDEVVKFKRLIAEILAPHVSALMMDLQYADQDTFSSIRQHCGLIVAVENGTHERHGPWVVDALQHESAIEEAIDLGADAINLSLYLHSQAPEEVQAHQMALMQKVSARCDEVGVPFILSPLLYQTATNVNSDPPNDLKRLIRLIRDQRIPIDLMQIENPFTDEISSGFAARTEYFRELSSGIQCPWVMLTAGSNIDRFKDALKAAFLAGASGFLGGRAFWRQASNNYPNDAMVRKGIEETIFPVIRGLCESVRDYGKSLNSPVARIS
ncbi:hypothetical protein ACNFBT_23815 [Pseudomonas sp. NY15181]|uniref:hypothetical protein n=1 Tax=Pseudomonas sp. NY15181 TaxID=3400349 RepID=UPI003A87C814